MILKSCVCGASKKNFKMDIGPFYVGECCKDAGYDDLGRLTASSVEGQAPESSDPSLLEKLFGRKMTAVEQLDVLADITSANDNVISSKEVAAPEYEPAQKIEVVEYNRVQESGPAETIIDPQGTQLNALQKFFGSNKPSRKKLKNMRVEELVALASAKGIEFKEGITKPAMIDAILAAE
jgi:hypothetical protein